MEGALLENLLDEYSLATSNEDDLHFWENITTDGFVFEDDLKSPSENSTDADVDKISDNTSDGNTTNSRSTKHDRGVEALERVVSEKKARNDILQVILQSPFRIQEYFNSGNLDELDDLFDLICEEECVFQSPESAVELSNLSEIKNMFRGHMETSPDSIVITSDVRYNATAGILTMKLVGGGTRQFEKGMILSKDNQVLEFSGACDPVSPTSMAFGVSFKVHEKAKRIVAIGDIVRTEFSGKWSFILNNSFTKVRRMISSDKKMIVSAVNSIE